MATSLLITRGLGDEEFLWLSESVCLIRTDRSKPWAIPVYDGWVLGPEETYYVLDVLNLVVKQGWCHSRGEARRVLQQGGMRHSRDGVWPWPGRVLRADDERVFYRPGDIFSKGKHCRVRVVPAEEKHEPE
ncbi:MAG: hypothetical protein ABFE07_28885 [Armatimonadia bacterium]